MFRSLILTLPLLLFVACDPHPNRQEIDLTDQLTDNPVDGIGHYVYALALPERVAAGGELQIQMDWRTVGPADGRKRYPMDVLLAGPERQEFNVDANRSTVGEINLVNWLNYRFALREDLPPGKYEVGVRLRDPATGGTEAVPLGFVDELKMGEGFYRVAEVEVL